MPSIRFRLSGSEERVRAALTRLSSIDQVDRIEQVADEEDHLRDDSSSPGLAENAAVDFHNIKLHALTEAAADAARGAIETAARDLELVVEFVDRF